MMVYVVDFARVVRLLDVVADSLLMGVPLSSNL
jgi:hypothetical protein